MAAPDAPAVLAHRVDQLAAELDLDRDRVLGWALAQSVLSLVWSIEDHGRVEPATLRAAQALATLAAAT